MTTRTDRPTPGGRLTLTSVPGEDLPITRLGFGAMRITGPGIWGPPADHDESIRVLRRSVELGCTFIDTADSYGPDISEQLIAEALHPYDPDVVVATKGGLLRHGPGVWIAHGHPAYLTQEIEVSLRTLRVERIDLYQLHRPDPAVPFEDSLGALVAAQAAGKIRHIGLSNVTVEELRRARAVTPIASVQNVLNIANRAHDEVLAACEEAGIAFIPYGPMGGGALTGADGPLGTRLDALAASTGASLTQLMIAWSLAKSPVMVPIPGTSRVDHLEENVRSAELTLSAADLETVESASSP